MAALAILDRLDEVDAEMLSWWLSERQLPHGGLNGRPEKLADVSTQSAVRVGDATHATQVCYSFWVLSTLSILNRVHWIDSDKLVGFILSAQDPETGGIADRPGDMVDVFHTHFGVAGAWPCPRPSALTRACVVGLSLLGYPGLVDVDPVYCMPARIIEAKGLRKGWKALPRRSA